MDNNSNIDNSNETIKIEETNINNEPKKGSKKNKAPIVILILVLLILIAGAVYYFVFYNKKEDNVKSINTNTNVEELSSEYRMSGNGLEDFDLAFMKLENDGQDMVYSPLSIKYALEMLADASEGESKAQIEAILGDYTSKKYVNSDNMSLANALFVKDTYKTSIKDQYSSMLQDKYNAELIYDSFNDASTINNWVSNKTFNLINNLLDDTTVSESYFQLVNALAIDMEWVNKIQNPDDDWYISYDHEDYGTGVSEYRNNSEFNEYTRFTFSNGKTVKDSNIGASINKYDIVSDKGEDNIREYVGNLYQEWLDSEQCGPAENQTPKDQFLDSYIDELNSNYNQIDSSTDFGFYTDDDIKVFQKDLKEYNGTTLQYIGIMPIKEDLQTYVNDISSDSINSIINSIKPIELDSFTNNTITEVYGSIPHFNTVSELDLISDLQSLGVTDIFEDGKADLSNLTDSKEVYIGNVNHKSNIEFTNDGIKAAAATAVGGKGSTGCEFDYLYEVPVEEIDLTFDKPYMYIIRDKDTGEVWFAGTVYNPTEVPTK